MSINIGRSYLLTNSTSVGKYLYAGHLSMEMKRKHTYMANSAQLQPINRRHVGCTRTMGTQGQRNTLSGNHVQAHRLECPQPAVRSIKTPEAYPYPGLNPPGSLLSKGGSRGSANPGVRPNPWWPLLPPVTTCPYLKTVREYFSEMLSRYRLQVPINTRGGSQMKTHNHLEFSLFTPKISNSS